MTKLPPFLTPDPAKESLLDTSPDLVDHSPPEPPESLERPIEPVAWTRSDVSFAPLLDPRLGPQTAPQLTPDSKFDPRRMAGPSDFAETLPGPAAAINFAPTSFDSVESGLQPIYEYEPGLGRSGQPSVQVEMASVPAKSASFLTRLKARIDESLPDDLQAARKPFLMGLLTGIVLMLLLGQIFRATQPETDFSVLASPVPQTTSGNEPVAFIDKVPNRL